MSWPLEAGTIVRINSKGHEIYGEDLSNPKGILGTVWEGDERLRRGWCDVTWDNGHTNSYEEGTLDIVQTVQLEND